MNNCAYAMAIASMLLSACASTNKAAPAMLAAATPAAAAPAAAPPRVAPPAQYDPRVADSNRRAKELGYHMETRHGEQFYCRSTAPIGSRLTQKQCLTAATMAEVAHNVDENNATFQQSHLCQGAKCEFK